MKTIRQWIQEASGRLIRAGEPDSARLDADLLVAFVTGLSRTSLFAHPDTLLTDEQLTVLDDLLRRRLNGEPLAYLVGHREFWSMRLRVAPGALIPRPDSETLVEKAIELMPSVPEGWVVELGTGSGAIAIALASELPYRSIVAVERSCDAVSVANDNIKHFAQNQILLLQSNWLDAIAGHSVAMVIANPPYLRTGDPHLAKLQYEPQNALVSGNTGLEDLNSIIEASRRVGKHGCLVILEHGFEQGAAVRALFQRHEYQHINTSTDLSGLERISYGYIKDTES